MINVRITPEEHEILKRAAAKAGRTLSTSATKAPTPHPLLSLSATLVPFHSIICADHNGPRDGEAERFGSLEVDDKLEFSCLLDPRWDTLGDYAFEFHAIGGLK